VKQAVEQGALPVARARMGNQAGGLVDDYPVRAFLHDCERDVLGCKSLRLGRDLFMDQQRIARVRHLLYTAGLTVEQHMSGLYPSLQAAAGMIRHQPGQNLVEPLRQSRKWNPEFKWSSRRKTF